MSQSRAMRSAFSTVFRQPAIYFAELVWRSTFAVTSLLLAFYGLIGFLDSREVTDMDLFGLFGFIPGTGKAALTHIFQGSGPVLVRTTVAVAFGIGLLWMVLATVGQSVTFSALFGRERPSLRAVAGWNVVRLAVLYLTIAALGGAASVAFLKSRLADGSHDRGTFYAFALPLWLLVFWIGMTVSSVIFVACLRQVQGRVPGWRRGSRQFVWVIFATGIMRAALSVVALIAFFIVIGMALQSPAILGWLLIAMFGLVYSAASTLVHLLKLAGYVRVLTWETEPPEAFAAVV